MVMFHSYVSLPEGSLGAGDVSKDKTLLDSNRTTESQLIQGDDNLGSFHLGSFQLQDEEASASQ